MVGCTRQSVNKLLGQFSDDGLIRLDRDGIWVVDLRGLTAASRTLAVAAGVGAVSGPARPRPAPRGGPRPPPARPASGPSVRSGRRPAGHGPRASGVEIAIDTAVSPVRGRARTASPTSEPPSSRARRAKRTRSSGTASSSVIAASTSSAAATSPDPCALRRRRIGCDRLVEPDPGRIAEQTVDAPARADLDDRERPAELLHAPADGLAPGRLAGRPDIRPEPLEDDRRRQSPRGRRRRRRRRPRRRSGRRPPRRARTSRRSGWSPAASARRAARRPATRRSRPAGRSATRPPPRARARRAAARPRRPTSGASRAAGRAARR